MRNHALDSILHLRCTFLADGSFVETPSGAAAHQLKRIYDQRLGVGKDFRSPFAITGFVNQHGRWMYRVGYVVIHLLCSR